MSNKPMSRRDFLSGMFKTATAGMLASILKFVPEAQGAMANSASSEGITVEPLSKSHVDELVSKAARETDGQILREFLASRGFDSLPEMVQGFSAIGETLNAQLLITGFSGAPRGASLLFVTGTIRGGAGTRIRVGSWAAWIAEEAAYVIKDGRVTLFPDGTERMRGVPRLPPQTTSENKCCPLYHSCWTLDALCVALSVCCFLGNAVCCAAAIAACLQAIAQCGQAGSCGSPQGCY